MHTPAGGHMKILPLANIGIGLRQEINFTAQCDHFRRTAIAL